jgi:hypothetical protein
MQWRDRADCPNADITAEDCVGPFSREIEVQFVSKIHDRLARRSTATAWVRALPN